MLYGYARVSSDAQDTALQLRALRAAGVRRIVEEKRSGATLARPVLDGLLVRLRRGDVLVVYKLDRLARSLPDLLAILRRLGEAGAGIRSLTEPVDTASAVGEFLVQVLGAVAQLELSMIRERCRAGREAARARGVVFGARRRIDYTEAARLRGEGLTWREVGQRLGANRHSVRNALARVRRGRAGLADPRG